MLNSVVKERVVPLVAGPPKFGVGPTASRLRASTRFHKSLLPDTLWDKFLPEQLLRLRKKFPIVKSLSKMKKPRTGQGLRSLSLAEPYAGEPAY